MFLQTTKLKRHALVSTNSKTFTIRITPLLNIKMHFSDEYNSFDLDSLHEDIDPLLKNESHGKAHHQGMEYLNNNDYSLNSPLIIDEVEQLTNFLKGLPYDRRWNENKWISFGENLKNSEFDYNKLNDPNGFQGLYFTHMHQHKFNHVDINQLIRETIKDSNEIL
nr:MAG: hypothetical protein [Rhabdovirus sp.]